MQLIESSRLLSRLERPNVRDATVEELTRVHSVEHLMRPEDNLAVQTEIIRNAEAFVGTYGGFSYLAPLCGVNTLAFYSHASGFRFDHLEVAKRVFSALRCGTFRARPPAMTRISSPRTAASARLTAIRSLTFAPAWISAGSPSTHMSATLPTARAARRRPARPCLVPSRLIRTGRWAPASFVRARSASA